MKPEFLMSGEQTLRVAYFAGTMRRGQDGVTRVLYRWIDGLRRAGMAHLFFSSIPPKAGECAAEVVAVPSVVFPLLPEYRLALPGSGSFEARLRAFDPDILHINSPCSLGLAAARFGRKHHIPVVATYHTHFPSYAKYYRIQALERFSWSYLRALYNMCDRVYVPSQPLVEELGRHGLKKLEYLPHGVDTDAFDPSFSDETWKKRIGAAGRMVLLYVGRLVWEKNLRVLADAWELLRGRGDVALVLVGEGPARAELELMIPDGIFLGRQDGTDLAAAYASSDLFVFPSTTETFGNVTLEAMASGLVPVCAGRGGAAGIIAHGRTGLLALPGDADDLAKHVEFLLDRPAEREAMADETLAYARRQGWDRIVRRMFDSYREVIRRAASRAKANQSKAA